MNLKLGKLPARHDPRTLRFASYAPFDKLPAPPPSRDWSRSMPRQWGMMRNDQIGDCAFAAAAHLIQTWTAQTGKLITPSDGSVVAAYSAVTGYRPDRPETDAGANMLDVLKYWRTTGIDRHRITAFAAVEKDATHVKIATNMFGGLYVGAMLPLSAQRQKGWLVPAILGPDDRAGSWGGHAMELVAYDRSGVTFVTWGREQKASWAWFSSYVDEIYACISPEWVDEHRRAPSGFDLDAMLTDLSRLS